MSVYLNGSINAAALVVPDTAVVLLNPDVSLVNGQPTNVFGIVGSASWGPVDSPEVAADYAGYAAMFGPIKNRKYDMGTILATAVRQGATNFRCVRVTDGNDLAASVTVQVNCLTLTSKYTGSLANGDQAVIGAGSRNGTWRISIVRAGARSEVFDNIGEGLSGAALWQAMADAINNGAGALRGPSGLVVATVGGGAAAPVAATHTLSGGADGAVETPAVKATAVVQANCLTLVSTVGGLTGNGRTVQLLAGTTLNTWKVVINGSETIDNIGLGLSGNALWSAIADAINGLPSTFVVAVLGAGVAAPSAATHTLTGGLNAVGGLVDADLVGVNASPRTGMYALAGAGCSVAALADTTATTSWAEQVAFGVAEGVYMMLVGASGQSISTAVANRNSVGIDTPWAKVILGDWCLWDDTVNGVQRYVSPQGFMGGQLVNIGPHLPGLNKPLYGIIATQKSFNNITYSAAELQQLGLGCVDVIASPSVGGAYFSPRFGRNSSSNPILHSDAYPRLTAFIIRTLNSALGIYVGLLQSEDVRAEAEATIATFLTSLWRLGMIGNAQGTIPFDVRIDDTNNPPNRVALGYMQAAIRIQYLSVIEYLIAEVQANQAVTIQSVQTQALAA